LTISFGPKRIRIIKTINRSSPNPIPSISICVVASVG
jgi:hypothetical protein